MNGRERAKRRRWADAAVLLAGAYVIVWGIWVSPVGGAEVDEATVQWTHLVGGGLALLSVFVALRSVMAARALLAVAVVALIVGYFSGFNDASAHGITSLLLPALVLLAAIPFIGPMPTPAEEGLRR